MKAIVFILRGCFAGWLGAYGNEWIATPHLDRLASEGVVFDRHISDCPDPEAACRAWLSGRSSFCPTSSPAGEQTVLPLLAAAGVRTVLVRANQPDTDAPDWFYAGWSEVFDARPQEEDRYPLDSLIRSLPGILDRLADVRSFLLWIEIDALIPPWNIRQDVFEAYVDDTDEAEQYPDNEDEGEFSEEGDEDREEEEVSEALDDFAQEDAAEPAPADDAADDLDDESEEQLDEEGEESHEDGQLDDEEAEEDGEPVTPWSDPPTGLFDSRDGDAREWLHWSLAAMVTGLDAELGVLFEQLRTRGLDRSAAWLLTSDHGYPLGEHGQIGRYRPWLHEELVHLPLLLLLPGAAEACRHVPAFTQPQDIAATLLDLLGVPAAAGQFDGQSLLPAARGEKFVSRPHAVSKLALGVAEELAIRTDEWAYLVPVRSPESETRQPLLYSKPDDRWEVNAVRNIEQADELEAILRGQPTEGPKS
jgi:arylsulfatase A-like enzyme